MKRLLTFAIVTGALTFIVGTRAIAQDWGRPRTPSVGACFYEDIGYSGAYFCEGPGASRSSIKDGNDRISSIRIFGSASVTVYEDERFRGDSHTYRSDAKDLRSTSWNDRISALRVAGGSSGGGAFGGGSFDSGGSSGSDLNWGRPSTPSTGVCFYQSTNFAGPYFCVRAGNGYEDVPSGSSNRISSIRIFGNAEVLVYSGRRYSGRSELFDYDVRNVRSDFNDQIVSFETRVRNGGGFGGGAFGGGGFGNSGGPIGRMEWRGRVDDRLQLSIRSRSVEQETVAGAANSKGAFTFTSALPSAAVEVSVNKLEGRGIVRVLQQPSRLNSYTAVIEINDNKGGADDYRLEVVWR